jgi:ATP synthase F1 complex assembly factor 2
LEKTLEKFWDKVGISEHKGKEPGNVVTLDGKPIKTAAGFPLLIPPSKSPFLAQLVAQEWGLLSSLKLKPYSLPLTSLASRAVDLQYSPEGAKERELATELMLPYLDTDTLLVFSPAKDSDGELRPAQEQRYRPVIAAAEQFWGTKLNCLDCDVALFGNYQTADTRAKVKKWIDSLDSWQFVALERATSAAKSLIGAMCLVTQKLTPDEVAELVTMEVTFQTQRWGEVEDTHDVEHADIRRLLGSAYIMAK